MKNLIIILVGFLILSTSCTENVRNKKQIYCAEELIGLLYVNAGKISMIPYYEEGVEVAVAIEKYQNGEITAEELRILTSELTKTAYAIWHQTILDAYEYRIALELTQIISGDYDLNVVLKK